MSRLPRSIFLALFLTAIAVTVHGAKTQAQDFVRIYAINPLTGDNVFNVSECPVGSSFTMEFYVGNVTDMISWQIHLTYNRTLIHYDKAWFPDSCIFKTGASENATPLAEVSNNVNNSSETADLLIIMTSSYPVKDSMRYPVTIESRGLLCKVNFTVASHPVFTQLDFVNDPSAGIFIVPSYYLPGYATSVETISGTDAAGGAPAVISDISLVPESLVLMLLFIALPTTLTLILTKRRRPKSGYGLR